MPLRSDDPEGFFNSPLISDPKELTDAYNANITYELKKLNLKASRL